jgi:spermidine synthase
MDAYEYLENCDEKYGVVIVDLPDPNNEALAKLYSNVFYRLCGNVMEEDGVLNIQSTSPYYATKSFWCVTKTLESEGFKVAPYHLQVPAFGDWGFNMAVKNDNEYIDNIDSISIDPSIETKYLNEENISGLFMFGKDEMVASNDKVEVNQLTKPVMIQYYNEAVRNWE